METIKLSSNGPKSDLWELIKESDGRRMQLDDLVFTKDGHCYRVTGGYPPRHSGSTGRVYLQSLPDDLVGEPTYNRELFPSVVGLMWSRIKRQ